MNYRHAFHAGNHTEVFKHAALTLILEHLLQKPGAFAVLDTHAGIGVYDLSSDEAVRTNEKSAGVEKIFRRDLLSAPTYSNALHALNRAALTTYPGSPELVRNMLRDGDRLVACELHPDDEVQLRARYRTDHRVSVHRRDGYEAMGALLPPPERRGLVFIDPPFERRDETELIRKALRAGFQKWASGIYLVWYPVKDATIGEAVASCAVAGGFSKILRAEFCPFRRDGQTLAGSGIVICNPPWTIDDKLRQLCVELVPLLGSSESSWTVEPVSGDADANQ